MTTISTEDGKRDFKPGTITFTPLELLMLRRMLYATGAAHNTTHGEPLTSAQFDTGYTTLEGMKHKVRSHFNAVDEYAREFVDPSNVANECASMYIEERVGRALISYGDHFVMRMSLSERDIKWSITLPQPRPTT
jgi:hypothetical protein